MIVLVPVSRFRVAYELARGRPYSRLERRVLEAIAHGGASLRTLRTTFRVHERLLVESVVTLVTAGWVAVAGGTEATFVLTVEGSDAVGTGSDPVSVVVSPAKPHILVLERVTGQLARNAEARTYQRDDLSDVWESAVVLTSRVLRNALDEAEVQKLLPRGTGEWVRWVGPITLASKNRHFLPVDVDLEAGQARGLPRAWHGPLLPHVLDAARRRSTCDEQAAVGGGEPNDPQTGRVAVAGQRPGARRRGRFTSVADVTTPWRPPDTFVPLHREDVLVGTKAHDRALAAALGSAARNLLLASPGLDPDRLVAFLNAASGAVERGVRVDVLPGATPPGFDQAAVTDAVNRAGYEAAGNQGRILMRTGTHPTGSGASLLLYDDSSGSLIAVVGDHDWLGPPVEATSVSVRIAAPSVVGDLARAAASLWTSGQGVATGAADRWRHLASAAEERAAIEEARAGLSDAATAVELVLDDEHAALGARTEGVALVGRFVDRSDRKEGSTRGLSLRLSGPGAEIVIAARAERG